LRGDLAKGGIGRVIYPKVQTGHSSTLPQLSK
jgi:hypothetical protein